MVTRMTSRLKLQRRALYFITPSVGTAVSAQQLPQVVVDAIRGGADLVQWRQKPSHADLAALPELRALWDSHRDAFLLPVAREIRAIAKEHDVPFIVNDSIDLALQLDADGVHVGQSDAALTQVLEKIKISGAQADFIIGVTVRDGIQARAACEGGATYLGAGPVFTSNTKPEANNGNTIGIDGLRDCTKVARSYGVPVYAIGGLAVENGRVRQCVEEGGAAGVSMIAAIASASDKEAAARAIKNELDSALAAQQ